MKIHNEKGIITMEKKIEEGDVIILENGNWEIINMIFKDGHYKSTIIDPEEMKYCKCYGDFNNEIQNECKSDKMEEM